MPPPKDRNGRASQLNTPQLSYRPGYSISGRRRRPATQSTPKTRGDATTTLTRQQSFDQMRIITLALISWVAYDRNLFPDIKYQLRQYNPEDPDSSYQSFVDGSTSDVLLSRHVNYWKVLPHGVQEEADQLLEWLDVGAFDAMERGYLKKFELTIHSGDGGKISYSNMIESYAMNFTYGSEVEIEFNGARGRPETLADAKARLYDLVENFRKTYRDRMATPLPRSARLGMVFAYNRTCPHDYVPPSFRAGDKETSKMCKTASGSGNLGLDLGFHELSLGWSDPSQLPHNSTAITPCTDLRSNLVEDLDSQTEPVRQVRKPPRNLQKLSNKPKRKPQTGSQSSSALRESQYDNIKRMQHWQQDRNRMDVTHDTQPLSSPLLRVNPRANPRPIDKGPLPYISDIFELIREKRAEPKARRFGEERFVTCGCESKDGTGGLVECEICGFFQHSPCYGYKFHVPKTHVCYRCLDSFTPDASQHPLDMAAICITRRALRYLEELTLSEELLSVEKLSKHLACDDHSTDFVLNKLVEQQFMTLYRRKNQVDEIEFLLKEENYSRYFHPEMGIEDYLSSNSDRDASHVQSAHRLSQARSTRSDHGPPSLSGDNSPGYTEASRMHSSGGSSSTASDGFLSSPEVDPDAASSTGRESKSDFNAHPPAKPTERKRRFDASKENAGNKKARAKQ